MRNKFDKHVPLPGAIVSRFDGMQVGDSLLLDATGLNTAKHYFRRHKWKKVQRKEGALTRVWRAS